LATRRFGARPSNQLDNLEAVAAPTVNDDVDLGYGVDSVWVDTALNKSYICTDATADNAVWEEVDDHAAITLAASAAVLMDLTGQAISLDTQAANTFLAGRVDVGAALVPTFRTIVALDLGTGAPSGAKFLRDDLTWQVPAGGGSMATDVLWAAKGDLAVGLANDSGGILTLTVPGAANLLNVLGVATGEDTPTYKVLFNATVGTALGVASAGTGVVAARANHVHPYAKSLWDADTDTGIQVEEGADDGIIRFDIEGVGNLMTLQAGGLDLNLHSAFGPDASLAVNILMDIQEANIGYAGANYGIYEDVGYAGDLDGCSLYGFYQFVRNNTVSAGAMSSLYGLFFQVSHQSPQGLLNMYGVMGKLASTVAGSGAVSTGIALYASALFSGAKPATVHGLLIDSTKLGVNGVTTYYGVNVADAGTTVTSYLLNIGVQASPYLRVIGGAAPAANQTNVYIKEQATVRQVQTVIADAGGHVAAGSRVMVLV